MSKYARGVAGLVAITSIATIGIATMSDGEEVYAAGFECYDEQENGFTDNIKDLSVSPTGDFVLYVKDDGTAWFRGTNQCGQAGSGDLNTTTEPRKVKINKKVVRVFASQASSYFLTEDGLMYACGYNKNGECGIGNTDNTTVTTPTLMPGLTNVKEISTYTASDNGRCGDALGSIDPYTTYFITEEGKLYKIGYTVTSAGFIGGGNTLNYSATPSLSPAYVTDSVEKFIATNTLGGGVIAKSDGSLYYYGELSSNKYNVNNAHYYSTPTLLTSGVKVNTLHYYDKESVSFIDSSGKYKHTSRVDTTLYSESGDATAITGAGYYYIGTDGKLYYAWTSSYAPTEVTSIQNPKELLTLKGAGSNKTIYCITKSGDLYAKGENKGAFGNGSSSVSSDWTLIASNVRDIYPSTQFCYILTKDGKWMTSGVEDYHDESYAVTLNSMNF